MKAASALAVIAMVLVAFLVAPVAAANADNDLYTSKYADVNPGYPTTGSITGAVRCHNNLLTKGVTITGPGNVTEPVELRNDGTFDITGLAPGQYVINIEDGNGGQPESATVTVQAGYVSYPESELLGHAVSPADIAEAKDVITVINATYGAQYVVVDHEAIPEHFEKAPHHSGDYAKFGNTYMYVGPCMGNYKKVPAVPAVTHIVGKYIDVKAQVQQAIDAGNREFVFNNAMLPGGIVNVAQDKVLVVIQDPASGPVKSVIINVEINGALKTINKMEYEVITI